MKGKVIDIHSHVVPGVDDGSSCLQESIRMLRSEHAQGVDAIIATPHSIAFDEDAETVRKRFDELKRAAADHNVHVDLYLGCEMLVYPEIIYGCISKLDDGTYPTMNGTRYVLTEINPYRYSPRSALYCIDAIVSAGYIPIIAHCERACPSVYDVRRMRSAGAMIQVNAYSVYSGRNLYTKRVANELLQQKLVDFIGSDAHRMDHRPPVVASGIRHIKDTCQKEYVNRVLSLNPEMLTSACQ